MAQFYREIITPADHLFGTNPGVAYNHAAWTATGGCLGIGDESEVRACEVTFDGGVIWNPLYEGSPIYNAIAPAANFQFRGLGPHGLTDGNLILYTGQDLYDFATLFRPACTHGIIVWDGIVHANDGSVFRYLAAPRFPSSIKFHYRVTMEETGGANTVGFRIAGIDFDSYHGETIQHETLLFNIGTAVAANGTENYIAKINWYPVYRFYFYGTGTSSGQFAIGP